MTAKVFRRTIALPTDHGSWVFLLSPLLIGLFASERFTTASGFLVVSALAAFLIRQPTTIFIKTISGRRSHEDQMPALAWLTIYSVILIAGITGLIIQGYSGLLNLGIPGILVFIWYLYLVSKRQERRQAGVEILGSGVLALCAPAAFWIGKGELHPIGWLLFALTWFQSAASIVYAYLRLEQRELKERPSLSRRMRIACRALIYTSFNLFAVIVLALLKILPALLFIPYGLQWMESLYGTLVPAMGYPPSRIGIRQLFISSSFTALFIVFWHWVPG